MWRLKREDIPGCPDAVRVSVEALDAATTGPNAITDTQVIAQLRQQLAIRDETITRLRAELDERPSERPFHGCPGCAGLRKTITEMDRAHAADRKLIVRLALGTPQGRGQTLGAPLRPMPDGGA